MTNGNRGRLGAMLHNVSLVFKNDRSSAGQKISHFQCNVYGTYSH